MKEIQWLKQTQPQEGERSLRKRLGKAIQLTLSMGGLDPMAETKATRRDTGGKEKRDNAGVTQLVEFQPSKLTVAGSIPVSRSNNTGT